MAIELLTESTLVATTSRDPVAAAEVGGSVRYARDTVVLTGTTTTNGSTYLCHRLPSNARLLYGSIEGVGSVDAPNVDVGVRQVNTPNTLVDGALATALDIDDTGAHAFIDFQAPGTQDLQKQMWEWAGLTSDPGGMFDIHLSLDADIVVAGSVQVSIMYVVD